MLVKDGENGVVSAEHQALIEPSIINLKGVNEGPSGTVRGYAI